MIDLPTLQAIATLGAMLVVVVSLFYWMVHNQSDRIRADMLDRMALLRQELLDRIDQNRHELLDRMDQNRQELLDRMDQNRQELLDRMDRNHQEILTLMQGHTHADGTPPVFQRVTGTAD